MSVATDTRTRLLDAAVEEASIHGLRRISVGDVAKRAGVSRPTLYKHFASKDALIAAGVTRETQALVAQILASAEVHDDARSALQAAVHETLRLTREHPLLDRIIRTEPDALLPVLTADGGPVTGLVRSAIDAAMAERLPELTTAARRRLADIVTRLLLSYAVSAPDDPPEMVAASVAAFLIDGAASLGPTTTLEIR